MSALVTRRAPPTFVAFAAGAIIAAAFAAPAIIALSQGLVAPSESRLTRAIVAAFGGITLPILGATVAGWFLGVGTRPRSRADVLVAAGLPPMRAVLPMLGAAIAVASLGASLVGAVVVAAVRAHHHLGGAAMSMRDAFGTAWALMLGAAAWTSIAALLVAHTGRAGRGWIVVAIDLGLRLLPGAMAWVAPSAHVANLLGAPPPASFVHVPVLSQGLSVVFLAVIALFATAGAARRYQGAP
jgi:hypothetical protein